MTRLTGDDLEVVSQNFYRWGESIGKNLKYGHEIDNSHRIAKLFPRVLVE